MEDDRSDVTLLVAAAAHGDEGAWGEIVDRYTPLVITVVLPFRLSSSELQDVAQTVWLHLIEHLSDIREPRALPKWLITTAKREAIRHVTASRRTQPTDLEGDAWSSRMSTEDDSDADLMRAERHAALLEGFAVLSPRQRELLALLSEDPPVPYAEISARMGIPIGAIGPTRARALDRLRQTPSVQQLMTTTEAEPTERRGR